MSKSSIVFGVDGLQKYLTLAYHRYLEEAILAFAELDMAGKLINATSQGLTAEEISRQDKWKPNLVHRILRACADANIVDVVGDDKKHFVLTESGKLLIEDHPSHARDLIRYSLGSLFKNISLYEFVGEDSQAKENGKDTTEPSSDTPANTQAVVDDAKEKEKLVLFRGAMTAFSTESEKVCDSQFDFSRFRVIADCGGCQGEFLSQILAHYPAIELGITFDLPCSVEQANNSLFEARKIDPSRYKFVAGDLFDSTTLPKADAYILKNVLHCFDDDNVVKILQSIRNACVAHKQTEAVVLIAEYFLLPDDGSRNNWRAHALDVLMGVGMGGGERTELEHKRLIEKAGLEFVKLHLIGCPTSLIEARIKCLDS